MSRETVTFLRYSSISAVVKRYHSIRELPRMISEYQNSAGTPILQRYPSDGLIFTPRKSGYKTTFDPNLFRWYHSK